MTEEEMEQEAKKKKWCCLEMGLCCLLMILCGVFIYLYEYTELIKVKSVEELNAEEAAAANATATDENVEL